MLLRTKDEFDQIFDISKSKNESISASKIQNWWRKISTGNGELTKRKNAVSKIEAWWIGTNTKRKINNALKSGKYIYSGKWTLPKVDCPSKVDGPEIKWTVLCLKVDFSNKSFSIGIWKWIQRFWS